MTDLALYAPPSASDLEQSWQLADRIARTEFVPPALRGKPEAVLACVLAGRELGIGPIQALQSIHVIQGRPTISADLMAGLVRRHGHRIRWASSGGCVLLCRGPVRPGGDDMTRIDLDQFARSKWQATPDELAALVAELRAAREVVDTTKRYLSGETVPGGLWDPLYAYDEVVG